MNEKNLKNDPITPLTKASTNPFDNEGEDDDYGPAHPPLGPNPVEDDTDDENEREGGGDGGSFLHSTYDADRYAAERKVYQGQHEFMLGVAKIEQLPPPSLAEIAFAGRSNVGKSSLINALTGRRTLARTSNTPGRTQELNFFNIGPGGFILVDMPGYGYAKVSRSQVNAWTAMLKAYLRGRVPLRLCCLLVDARHGLKASDIEMMKMLDESAVPYRVIMTKADKCKKADLEKVMKSANEVLKKHPAGFPTVHLTSSEKKYGIEELQDILLLSVS